MEYKKSGIIFDGRDQVRFLFYRDKKLIHISIKHKYYIFLKPILNVVNTINHPKGHISKMV